MIMSFAQHKFFSLSILRIFPLTYEKNITLFLNSISIEEEKKILHNFLGKESALFEKLYMQYVFKFLYS